MLTSSFKSLKTNEVVKSPVSSSHANRASAVRLVTPAIPIRSSLKVCEISSSGESVGIGSPLIGLRVGSTTGSSVGFLVGVLVGVEVGPIVGCEVGGEVGPGVGGSVGKSTGGARRIRDSNGGRRGWSIRGFKEADHSPSHF